MHRFKLREVHGDITNANWSEVIVSNEDASEAALGIVLHLARQYGDRWRAKAEAVRWLVERFGFVPKQPQPDPGSLAAEARKRAVAVFAMFRTESKTISSVSACKAATDLVVQAGVLGPAEGWFADRSPVTPPPARVLPGGVTMTDTELQLMREDGISITDRGAVLAWVERHRQANAGIDQTWQRDKLLVDIASMIDAAPPRESGAALAKTIVERCEQVMTWRS